MKAGDSIQLRSPGSERGIDYTPTIRRRLVPRRSNRFLAETEIVGRVLGIDRSSLVAILQLDDGSQVEHPLEEEHFETFRDALTLGDGPKLRVTGFAVVDESQRVLKVESITSVERISRIDGRLDELAALDDGWLGDDEISPGPSRSAVNAARGLAHRLETTGVGLRLYPSTEGGISLQWKLGERLFNVEVSNTTAVYVLIVDTASGTDAELDLPGMDEDQVVDFVTEGA